MFTAGKWKALPLVSLSGQRNLVALECPSISVELQACLLILYLLLHGKAVEYKLPSQLWVLWECERESRKACPQGESLHEELCQKWHMFRGLDLVAFLQGG